MRVLISAEAERNLEAIADYIAERSPSRAVSFLEELRTQCLGLAEHPERFPLVGRYRRLGIRRRVHGEYLIFYRVHGDEVMVLHILQGAQDYERILGEDDQP